MKRIETSAPKLLAKAAAVLLLAGGLGVAQAQSAGNQGGMDHGAMGHGGGMDHGNHGGGGMGGMGGMDHGGGGMGGMMGGGMMGGMMGGGMAGGMGGMMKKMICGLSEHTEGRLAYLKAELKLTDQQQAAWNSFADGYKAAAQKAGKQCEAMDQQQDHKAHAGVLGHLNMMEQHMTGHLEIVRGLKSAIEPLFAVLTEDQKKAANEDMSSVMGIGMGNMGKMMGH